MWCLARFSPLIVGDIIPRDDSNWGNFLTFLDILDYTLSPATIAEKTAFLSVLVEDFLTEFSKLYDHPLTPKLHYMVHIPSWIMR